MWRWTIAVGIGIATFIGLVRLGNFVFDRVAVPDLCDYHNGTVVTSWLFDLFFPMTALNGYHPGPGPVFHLTAIFGGWIASILFFRWANGKTVRK
jgi:hypothetical protein